MLTLRNSLAAIAACLLISSPLIPSPSLAQQNPEGIEVHDPYARAVGGIGASGAIFLILHNHGDIDLTLTGASSPDAEMVGLHTSVESADGVMQMLAIDGGISLPAGAEHELARGGDHIMLMGLTRDLQDGDTVTVTLTFDAAAPLTFEVVVDNARKPGASGQEHGAMTGSKAQDHAAMGHGAAASAMPGTLAP